MPYGDFHYTSAIFTSVCHSFARIMDDDVNFCLFCHGTEDLMANNLGDILYECIVWLTCIEIKSKNLMSGTVTTGLSHYGLSMAVRDEFLSIWANTWTSLREI